jgi:hypothetical protein
LVACFEAVQIYNAPRAVQLQQLIFCNIRRRTIPERREYSSRPVQLTHEPCFPVLLGHRCLVVQRYSAAARNACGSRPAFGAIGFDKVSGRSRSNRCGGLTPARCRVIGNSPPIADERRKRGKLALARKGSRPRLHCTWHVCANLQLHYACAVCRELD